MTQLVDIVNFNADASCLSASSWMAALRGGNRSTLYQWLHLYVELGRPVVLGLTGATVADMVAFNPETLSLINAQPDTFEMVLRPFSHDIALLRSPAGFALNVSTGRQTIESEFKRVCPFYLPAEFMLTNGQVHQLQQAGIVGTFVNAFRFKQEIRDRISACPYFVHGVYSARLRCIPIRGDLTEAYLQSLHLWDVVRWNQAVRDLEQSVVFSWRDGESFLFVPGGVERERAWLQGESTAIKRTLLSDVQGTLDFAELDAVPNEPYRSYPVHSFSDWIKEFRMFGYLARLAALEQQLATFDDIEKTLWFLSINSDIFSAVEKDSPVITLRTAPSDASESRDIRWTIRRSERGFEGEEFLEMLAAYHEKRVLNPTMVTSVAQHLAKFQARLHYLQGVAT